MLYLCNVINNNSNMNKEVVLNEAEHRFEIQNPEGIAFVEFNLFKNGIVFTHTEVPPALEGNGLAGILAKHVLEYAKAQNWEVLPLCPYIKGYIDRHDEYKSISSLHREK